MHQDDGNQDNRPNGRSNKNLGEDLEEQAHDDNLAERQHRCVQPKVQDERHERKHSHRGEEASSSTDAKKKKIVQVNQMEVLDQRLKSIKKKKTVLSLGDIYQSLSSSSFSKEISSTELSSKFVFPKFEFYDGTLDLTKHMLHY